MRTGEYKQNIQWQRRRRRKRVLFYSPITSGNNADMTTCILLIVLLLVQCPTVYPLPDLKKTVSLARSSSRRQRDKKNEAQRNVNKNKHRDIIEISTQKEDYGDCTDHCNDNSVAPLLVQSILVPRNIRNGTDLRLWIRIVGLFSLAMSLIGCIRTSGMPYANAISHLLYQQGDGKQTMGGILKNVVSPLNVFIAQLKANTVNEIIPPQWLPSPLPLIGGVFSVLLLVGGLHLLPQWFLSVRLWLDYESELVARNQRESQHAPFSEIDKISQWGKDSSNKMPTSGSTPFSVLVHLEPQDYDTSAGNSRNRIVCPLHTAAPTGTETSSSKSSKNTEGSSPDSKDHDEIQSMLNSQYNHIYPYYFEVNQCRYYFNPSTGECRPGSPTFHTAPLHLLDKYVRRMVQQSDAQDARNLKIQEKGHNKHNSSKRNSKYSSSSTYWRNMALDRYGLYNRPQENYLIPTTLEAFVTRISSPLVVVQLVGRIVSILEEEPFRSLIDLASTLSHHYWNAQQAIRSSKQLASDVQTESVHDSTSCKVWILRQKDEKPKSGKKQKRSSESKERKNTVNQTNNRKQNKAKNSTTTKQQRYQTKETMTVEWVLATAVDLVPGDIFFMSTKSNTNNDEATDMKRQAHANEHQQQATTIPVDALVLRGQTVTNEAILTGESIPQSKTPIDFLDEDENGMKYGVINQDDENLERSFDDLQQYGQKERKRLDIERDHRNSVLFAGTTMIYCASSSNGQHQITKTDDKTKNVTLTTRGSGNDGPMHSSSSNSTVKDILAFPPLPKAAVASNSGGVTCLALRTGTYSSKGELLRTLQSNTHVGSISNRQSELDAMRLIGSLSLCALASCISLFVPRTSRQQHDLTRTTGKKISTFRRIVQCTRIIIASIPSDLPLALSAVARSCSYKLRQDADVVCSEPGSLLTAAHVDTVVFDKTGTLTADTQSLSKLVSNVPNSSAAVNRNIQRLVLAGCHSLVHIIDTKDNNDAQKNGKNVSSMVVGDPLDAAALQYSGWKYNNKDDCYELVQSKKEASSSSHSGAGPDPIRLWQIKTFPFDPSKRMSSAVVLVQFDDESYRIMSLMKGSPDNLNKLYRHRDDKRFMRSQTNRLQQLEADGYRTVALGTQDLTNRTHLVNQLFPGGELSSQRNVLRHARGEAENILHRSDIEGSTLNVNERTVELDFTGFACFETAIRPSSQRIIKELFRGGIQVTMLTGDAIDAALAVALKVGLIRERSVAILETKEKKVPTLTATSTNETVGSQTTTTETILVWRNVKLVEEKTGKQGKKEKRNSSSRFLHKNAKVKAATMASVRDILKQQRRGDCSIAITGSALEQIFSKGNKRPSSGGESIESMRDIPKKVKKHLIDHLDCVSVIARATPSLKNDVVSRLKDRCGRTVLMCGDGVNDVAAMKTADVAMALLNGFGSESSIDGDVDNKMEDTDEKRRRQRLAKMVIGRNRKTAVANKRKAAKLSTSAAKSRINAQVEAEQKAIRERAAARQGLEPDSPHIQYTPDEMKQMFSAALKAARDERRRATQLKAGGGTMAAKILAEEDEGLGGNVEANDDETSEESTMIKPGEASLVASFSCLRPSIAGVDSILRAGIASAASSLSTQQSIALESLKNCFYLASLYRDGFRYGKKMWPVEYTLYMLIDRARYSASCTPRPCLPLSSAKSSRSFQDHRPPKSMFASSSILSILGQAIIHLVSITIAVTYGNRLESMTISDNSSKVGGQQDNTKRMTTLIHSQNNDLSTSSKLAMLADALAEKIAMSSGINDNHSEHEDQQKTSFFRRPPFRPNYETNIVFIFSILHDAVSALTNHMGKPYYGSILESRQLCLYSGFSILFAVAMITETFPTINDMLELRRLPTSQSKWILLSLASMDIGVCVLCKLFSNYFTFFSTKIETDDKVNNNTKKSKKGVETKIATTTAAAEEEKLLKEEEQENLRLVLLMCGLMLMMITELVFVKPT